MALSYLDAINKGYPSVQVHCFGNPFVYDDLVWSGGDALPSQDDLDVWIAEESVLSNRTLTKLAFRKLFTLPERVAVDNASQSTALPAQYKALLATMAIDLSVAVEVHLDDPVTAQGVQLLEQLGLIGPGRAAQILSNTPAE